ncbi:hypothetical protein FQR65_LT06245 [Abscondita terminalis]|nr:hypothetical protein FQR65_LT06245 [Abscondita terminalis]
MFFKTLELLLFLMIIIVKQISANYFCELTCPRGPNTVCLRNDLKCSASSACGTKFKMMPFDDRTRNLILNLHNELRNELALGNDKRGGNGVAANMRALSYDKEIEFVAQCYANACRDMGNHDKCRRTKKFKSVGQNMYALEASDSFNFNDDKWIKEAINQWYIEITDTNTNDIDKFQQSDRLIGHFTQMVWAETTHIGCGRTIFGSGPSTKMSIYCNYGTGGNVLNRGVYARGPPCSQCGSAKCNNQYKGLCGDVEDLKNDKWVPPFGLGRGASTRSSLLISMVLTYISVLLM